MLPLPAVSTGMKISRLRYRLLISVAIFSAVCLLGVIGYVIMGWKLIDAVYMVVITIFGVGYGEVEPVDQTSERIFTILLIICGNSAAIYVVGEVVRTLTGGEIVKALGDMQESKKVEEISHHTIICGWGRIGQVLSAELSQAGHKFIIVDVDKERIADAHTRGYLVVEGSATDEDTLIRAGINRADVLATVLPQDTLNVFITLTARNLNPLVRIIARGEQPATEKKLRQAGANEVILPATIGALRIAHSITKPSLTDFIGGKEGIGGADFHHLGLEIHELSLKQQGHLEGWTIGEIQRAAEGKLMVLAIRKPGGEILRKDLDTLALEKGDALVVMAHPGRLPEFLVREVTDTEIV